MAAADSGDHRRSDLEREVGTGSDGGNLGFTSPRAARLTVTMQRSEVVTFKRASDWRFWRY